MAQMQALLKIKADVEGEGKINALGRAIGGLSSTAGRVQGGLKGLAGAAGGLSGALGALVPIGVGAGLAGIATNAINAADNMNDLSQKTGVSVESLSKFQQAANASGTSIEGVGAAMLQFTKRFQGGAGPAADALKALSISATDASGKLKSTDKIMLEVADKFKNMEDGGKKAELAFALFGKAGADMIPMLNGGSKAISDLKATMSTDMAQNADRFNDKMEALKTKAGELGLKIGSLLLPYLEKFVDLLLAASTAFSNLPGPLQVIIAGSVALGAALVLLAPAIAAVITIAGVLAGLQIGATIAGWAGIIGPAITAISAAFTGFLTFLTGTLLPGLLAFFSGPVGWTVLAVAAVVAMAIAFREPIMQFFTWLGGAISTAFSGLMGLLQPIFVQPFIDLWNNVLRGPVMAMFDWIGGYIQSSMKTALALAELVFVKPWVNLWNVVLRKPVTTMIGWLQTTWKGITKFFGNAVVTPISKAWTALNQLLPDAMKKTGEFVQSVWTGIINNIKNVMRGMLNFVVSGINTAVNAINYLIDGYNRIPVVADIPRLGILSVPAFAEGGIVDRPTLAMVGEGGEREYIIPQSKMAAASANFLGGARGGAVISQASGGGGGGSPQISITTGPVLQQGGEQYVTLYDLERAMQMTADGVYKSLRTSSGRYATGVR